MNNDWKAESIEKLFKIRPPKKEALDVLNKNELVSFVPMANLNEQAKELILNQKRQLSDVYSGYTYFAENDVLLAKITPCFENGKLGIARNLENGIGFGSSEFFVFRTKGRIIPEYLFYFLSNEQFRTDGKRQMTGAVGHKRVPKEFIENYKLPFPTSLDEQKRIVKILDEAFAAINKAKANAEKNLQNSQELFDSYMNKVFASPGEDWQEKTLGEIASVKGGKRVPKGYKYESLPTDYPYITVADFTDDGTVNTTSLKFISDEVYRQIERYTITSEDLYISIAGTIGKTGIIPKEIDGANLTENACKLIFHNGINKNFVYFFTKSPSFKYQAGINTRIAAQPKLALERLKTITMHLPGNEEQKKIVSKFDKLSSEIKKLKSNYQQKLSDLEELKKSILQKAFEGQLTIDNG